MRRKSFSNIYTSLLGGALLAVLVTGCNTEDFNSPSTDEKDAVIITAGAALSTDAESKTRATNDIWEAGDLIGITMLSRSTPATPFYTNRQYKAASAGSGDVQFNPESEGHKMYYPIDGSEVTFKAYYPYTGLSDYRTYPVNVSGQSDIDIARLDLMTAEHKNVDASTANSKNKKEAHLVFHHRLTMVTVNLLTETDSPIDLTGSTLKVKGMKTTGSYNLLNDVLTVDAESVQDIYISLLSTPTGRVGTAILLPREAAEGVVFEVITKNGGVYTAAMESGLELKGGSKYTFNLTLKTTPALITASIEDWTEGPIKNYNVVHPVVEVGANEGFKQDDQLRLYIKDNGDSDYSYNKGGTFTFNGAKWEIGTPIYWENFTGPVNFRATYTYASALNLTQMPDYLVGETSADLYGGVHLQMKHVGAKLTVKLKSTDGTFTAADLTGAEVILPGYLNSATLNSSTGAFEPGTTTDNITLVNGVALFPPQTIKSGNIIKVSINGRTYEVPVEAGGFEYKSATAYEITLDVKKAAVVISTKIVPWVTEDLGTKEVRIGKATLGNNQGDLKIGDKLYLFTGDDTNRSSVGNGYFEYTSSGWVHKNASATDELLYWENIPHTGSIYASITRDEITPGNNQSKDYITAVPVVNNGGSGNTALNFEMSHKVAQVQIKLTSDVYTTDELKSAEITLPAYMTGGTEVNGIYKSGSISGDIKLAAPNNSAVTTSAYLQPQTITAPKTLVKVKIKGREYLINHTVAYVAGQITKLNIDIKASEAQVSVSVKPWDNQAPVDIRFFFTESETSISGFENNDVIRFYKMKTTGVSTDTKTSTYKSTSTTGSLTNWSPDGPWYRDDFKTGDQFKGVFPASLETLGDGVNTFTWTCKGNSDGTENTTNHQHDILVSTSTSGKIVSGSANVALDFIHVLSKITVEIYPEDGFTKADLEAAANVTPATLYPILKYFIMDGTVNVTEAKISSLGSTEVTFRPTKLGSAPTGAAASYEALIMPQTINAKSIIDIKFEGQTYEALFNPEGSSVLTTFKAGENHVFRIYLKKTGILLSTSVAPWGTGTGGEITIQ